MGSHKTEQNSLARKNDQKKHSKHCFKTNKFFPTFSQRTDILKKEDQK